MPAQRPRPYLPFIRDTLAQYPTLRATRIHEMVRQRGYPGSVIQVRRLVRRLRPESTRTVYRRVVTLPGESAQVDWGSFGKVRIGRGTRAVSGFVMVLGHSRAVAALFTLDQTLESFLRGHAEAFQALGGVARTLVYDNLRTAVLDRRGAAVQFHPRLLELAGHYHFAPRPCTPGRGNEKGKVERQIQYLRHAFFAARPFRDLDDLNTQFRRWRDGVAHQRRHPRDAGPHRRRRLGRREASMTPTKGETGVVDVQPVDVRQAAVELEHDAHVGQVADAPQAVLMPEELRAAIVLFASLLDERRRRLFAGLESLKCGWGGDRRIAALLGIDPSTVATGRRQLVERDVEGDRVRRAGGGRTPTEKKRPKSSPASKS